MPLHVVDISLQPNGVLYSLHCSVRLFVLMSPTAPTCPAHPFLCRPGQRCSVEESHKRRISLCELTGDVPSLLLPIWLCLPGCEILLSKKSATTLSTMFLKHRYLHFAPCVLHGHLINVVSWEQPTVAFMRNISVGAVLVNTTIQGIPF